MTSDSALQQTVSLTLEQALKQAIAHQLAGRLAEAERLYQSILKSHPDHPEVNHNLGMLAVQLGKPTAGLPYFKAALDANPGESQCWLSYIDALIQASQFDTARQILSEGQQKGLNGQVIEALAGRLESPSGNEPSPQEINAVMARLNDGRLMEAANLAQAMTVRYPLHGVGWKLLGMVLKRIGRSMDALALLQKAAALSPNDANAHYLLGNTFCEFSRLSEAEACYQRAIQVKPDFAEAYCNLGNTLRALGRPGEAENCCRNALKIKPDYAEAHNNLGCALNNIGQLDNAVASFRRALLLKPELVDTHINLIATLDLASNANMSELHGERKNWDETYAAPLWQNPAHANDPIPTRRLRVGYVSADFKAHSALKVFGGMLTQYDHSQFDVFAYSNLKGKGDRLTDLIKQNVTAWRNILGLSDEAVAKMIREDCIDILVDLSGYTEGNRLLVFARKPAPIQITAWGYATGTGMRAMDVFFADPVMVPPQDKQYFSEEVRYLPSVVGFFSFDSYPDVNKLPALSDGIITFGSLNRLVKVSAEAYRVWAEVLLAVPRSRLILKTGELDDAAARERAVEHFTKAGVDADRIIMQGGTSWHEHMQAYNQIDIALDPFPHGGGVTALEGLMMGVPVITLRWPTTVGRLSASIMTTMGLTDWIAESTEEYVELAIKKVADLQSLAVLRQQLRGIFTSSIIGDQVAYARAVEQEYRKLWQEWCSSAEERRH